MKDSLNSKKNDYINKLKEENITSETNIGYELFNIVSENGDSIYSLPNEDVMSEEKGQVYVSLSKIRKIVNEELDKRVGASLNNKIDQRKS